LIRLSPLLLLVLPGCAALIAGPQSALDPAGPNARTLATLFWVMAGGGAMIWFLTIGVAVWAARVSPGAKPERAGHALILGGGVIFPTVVLAALLGYGLAVMADQRSPFPQGSDPDLLRIHVSGEQWWWRVHYYAPQATEAVVSANEIRLPVGVPVEFTLTSPDVIHSFWIPVLGGKLDMIPGRVNRFVLEADETGTFRGECAEFCGTSHALMAFAVEVMEPDAFDAWLRAESAPAEPAATPTAQAALATFMDVGCDACHAIRGTAADGRIGPDLTHLGRRHTIAAGILPNNAGTIAGWIADTQSIKPGNKMPPYDGLTGRELRELSEWLAGLGT
jgi:cytochrome c oxidase subunit 2